MIKNVETDRTRPSEDVRTHHWWAALIEIGYGPSEAITYMRYLLKHEKRPYGEA